MSHDNQGNNAEDLRAEDEEMVHALGYPVYPDIDQDALAPLEQAINNEALGFEIEERRNERELVRRARIQARRNMANGVRPERHVVPPDDGQVIEAEPVDQVFQDLVREFHAVIDDDSSGIGTDDEEAEDENPAAAAQNAARAHRINARRARAAELIRRVEQEEEEEENDVLIGYLRDPNDDNMVEE